MNTIDVDAHVKGDTSRVKLIADVGIAQLLINAAIKSSDRIAAHFDQQNVHLTFGQLCNEMNNLAAGLLSIGLTRSDHILLWGANHPQLLIAMYACRRIGAIFCTVNPNIDNTGGTLQNTLALADIKAIICYPTSRAGEPYRHMVEMCPELRTASKGHLVSGALPKLTHVIMAEEEHRYAYVIVTDLLHQMFSGTFTLSEVYGRSNREKLDKLPTPSTIGSVHQLASLQFSTGTTGSAKLVMLSDFQLINACLVAAERLHLDSNQTLCCPMPLFRAPVMCLAALSPIVVGNCVVYPSAQPTSVFKCIESYKCTYLLTNPIALNLMLRMVARCKTLQLDSLNSIVFIGERVPNDLVGNLQTIANVRHLATGICLTEVGCMPIMTEYGTTSDCAVVQSQGKVVDHFEVQILAFDGSLAKRRQLGQICIRPLAGSDFLGYYKETERSRSFFVHGWILTGDVGSMDNDGNIEVVAQYSDMVFDANGAPIATWTIERTLSTNRHVLAVQVIGVASGQKSQQPHRVIAVVIARSATLDTDYGQIREELINMCRANKLSVPDDIVFVKEYPRTAHSKRVQKYKLREMFANGAPIVE